MPLVAVGVLLLFLKVAEIGPFGGWSWWWVLSPFAAAAVWWQVADSTGYTQRKAIEKMDKRKADRRDRALEALGQHDRQRDRQAQQPRGDATKRRDNSQPGDSGRSASEEAAPRRDPTG